MGRKTDVRRGVDALRQMKRSLDSRQLNNSCGRKHWGEKWGGAVCISRVSAHWSSKNSRERLSSEDKKERTNLPPNYLQEELREFKTDSCWKRRKKLRKPGGESRSGRLQKSKKNGGLGSRINSSLEKALFHEDEGEEGRNLQLSGEGF